MAMRHGEVRIGVHEDHMKEKHLTFLHDHGGDFVENRKVETQMRG